MNNDIDAVVSWVDGADQKHRDKRNSFIEREENDSSSPNAAAVARFQDNGELRFCLYSLRKFAPWLRKIYLITDDQRPAWLSSDVITSLGVVLVDHKELFSEDGDLLPTFNSRSIETMLAQIPGLSERFIYLNDDMALTKRVVPADFFQGDKLVVRARWGVKSRWLERKLRRFTFWHRRGYICRRPGVHLLPGRIGYFDLAHAPHGLFKSDFQAVFTREARRSNARFRFRSESQLSPVGFVINTSRVWRPVARRDKDWVCFFPEKSKSGVFSITGRENLNNFKFVCFQDLQDFGEARRLSLTAEMCGRLGLSLDDQLHEHPT
ncbi:Stealth CR1 domain-containing protein [Salinisphaera sp. SPP-AMP-43]|uniref:Stealth CR1 domain-containing protein n=1 Tax=Salinisphaera sp. SPP-AMP-43 TaxID=3121288 RepID=UPI003C6E41DB